MSKKDKIEKGTNIFSNLIKKSAKNKKLKKEQKVNDFFNNLPKDIQKRIKNKEKNIIKKDRKTKEELSEAKTNTIFRDPTVKSYERYLDGHLDRSITRKLKQNDIEIQADYKKMMDKIEDDYKKTSDTGKALTKARDERKLKDGGSVNKKKPATKDDVKTARKMYGFMEGLTDSMVRKLIDAGDVMVDMGIMKDSGPKKNYKGVEKKRDGGMVRKKKPVKKKVMRKSSKGTKWESKWG